MKKITALILLLLITACGEDTTSNEWQTVPLTDVVSGETFTLADFRGQVVIIEAMAVWCPQCSVQQQMISAAASEIEGDVVVVSLDVDPNEDVAVLRQHAELQGWDWRFAITTVEMSQLLQAAYGPQILAPTATPVLIISPDGTTVLTPFGIKGWEELMVMIGEARN